MHLTKPIAIATLAILIAFYHPQDANGNAIPVFTGDTVNSDLRRMRLLKRNPKQKAGGGGTPTPPKKTAAKTNPSPKKDDSPATKVNTVPTNSQKADEKKKGDAAKTSNASPPPPGAWAPRPGSTIPKGPNVPGKYGWQTMEPKHGKEHIAAIRSGIKDPNIKDQGTGASSKETAHWSQPIDPVNNKYDKEKFGTDSQNYSPMRMSKDMLRTVGYPNEADWNKMNSNTPEGNKLSGEAYEKSVNYFSAKPGHPPDISGFYAMQSGGRDGWEAWRDGKPFPKNNADHPSSYQKLRGAYEKLARTYKNDPKILESNDRPYTDGDHKEHHRMNPRVAQAENVRA